MNNGNNKKDYVFWSTFPCKKQHVERIFMVIDNPYKSTQDVEKH